MSSYGYLDQLIEEKTNNATEKESIGLELSKHSEGVLKLEDMSDKAQSIFLQWEFDMEGDNQCGDSEEYGDDD